MNVQRETYVNIELISLDSTVTELPSRIDFWLGHGIAFPLSTQGTEPQGKTT